MKFRTTAAEVFKHQPIRNEIVWNPEAGTTALTADITWEKAREILTHFGECPGCDSK